MPILLHRLWTLVNTTLHGWRLPLAVAAAVFVVGWLGLWLAEPANAVVAPANYWWWFLVTASTVGYGDLYPETAWGHVVGGFVIIGGIVTLTILFTRVASFLQTARGKRVKGLSQLDVGGHVVIIGYLAGRTERMVSELSVEREHPLVLCAWDDVTENPMAELAHVQFVRGDPASTDVMTRACVARARTVIIDGRDDNESLAIALAVDHIRADLHIVVAVREMTRREQLRYVNEGIQCVQWHVPNQVTEEALDPGISQVYADLMTGGTGGNTYSATLPAGVAGRTFGDLQTRFGRRFGATLIAVRTAGHLEVSPPWDTEIVGGVTVYYLGRERIEPSELAALARQPTS